MPCDETREDILHDSLKLGLTASALFVAASGAASAADIAVGTYSVNGFTTSSTCTIPGSPQKGEVNTATIIYPGAGKAGMILANPATTKTSKAGSGATQVCVAAGKIPATGLNNATVTFNCYNDTEAGEAKTPLATIKAKFKVGATHTPQIVTVGLTATVTSPVSCKFTTDGTNSLN
jgi:hypothetical protein